MRKLLILLQLIIAIQLVNAQDSTITLSELAAPTAPGFMLLGVSEADITAESPRAFTLGILNQFAEANGIPKNLSIELTPYWYIKSKRRTALNYMGYNSKKKTMNPFSGIKQTSISLAYLTETNNAGKNVRNVAVGSRANLFRIYPKSYKEQLHKSYNATRLGLQSLLEAQQNAGATFELMADSPKRYQAIIDSINTLYSQKDSISPLTNVLATKPILSLNAASAYSFIDAEGDSIGTQFGRFGAWLTLKFSLPLKKDNSSYIHLYGYGRYLVNGASDIEVDDFKFDKALDIGGKLEIEVSNSFSIAYEFLRRKTTDFTTFRSAGIIQYKIKKDIFLTGSFGKDFGTIDNLISLMGLKLGLNSTKQALPVALD